MTENGRPAGPAKCQVSSIEPHTTQSWRAAERGTAALTAVRRLLFLPTASITVPSDQTLAEAGTWGRAQFAGPTESPSREKGGRDSAPEGGLRWVGCDLRGEEEAALAHPVPSGTAPLSSAPPPPLRPEPGNKSTTTQNWVQRRAGWRQRGIAKVWFPPLGQKKGAEGPGKDDRGIATGQEAGGADAEQSARDWPRCSNSIACRVAGWLCVVPFALLCVVHVVRAMYVHVCGRRES